MNEFESPQPPPPPEDEAIIRDIMDKKGVSFAEARLEWEIMRAKVNQEKLEQGKEEDENE